MVILLMHLSSTCFFKGWLSYSNIYSASEVIKEKMQDVLIDRAKSKYCIETQNNPLYFFSHRHNHPIDTRCPFLFSYPLFLRSSIPSKGHMLICTRKIYSSLFSPCNHGRQQPKISFHLMLMYAIRTSKKKKSVLIFFLFSYSSLLFFAVLEYSVPLLSYVYE